MAVDTQSALYPEETLKLAHCTCCDRPFAPQEKVEFAIDLLKQAGMNETIVEERRSLLQTCTDCKSRQSVHSMRHVKMTLFLQKGNKA